MDTKDHKDPEITVSSRHFPTVIRMSARPSSATASANAAPTGMAAKMEERTLNLGYGLSLLREMRQRLKRYGAEAPSLEHSALFLESLEIDAFLHAEKVTDLDTFIKKAMPLFYDMKHLQRTYGIKLKNAAHADEARMIRHALETVEIPAGLIRRRFEVIGFSPSYDVLIDDSFKILHLPCERLGSLERDGLRHWTLHISRHLTDAVRQMNATSSHTMRDDKEPKLLRKIAGVILHYFVEAFFKSEPAETDKILTSYREQKHHIPPYMFERFAGWIDPHLTAREREQKEIAILAEEPQCWTMGGVSQILAANQ